MINSAINLAARSVPMSWAFSNTDLLIFDRKDAASCLLASLRSIGRITNQCDLPVVFTAR